MLGLLKNVNVRGRSIILGYVSIENKISLTLIVSKIMDKSVQHRVVTSTVFLVTCTYKTNTCKAPYILWF